MICPTCGVEMVLSKAIKPKYDIDRVLTIVPRNPIVKPEDVVLIDCLKCPLCGYSDDMK